MATREIKTTIEIDGEQKFKQALSAATREMRVMESELKAVSAAYDTNGNSAEYFAAKQANLRDQISQQRQIIQALEIAVSDAARTYGEASHQADGYAIRLNNARTRMSRLEKQLEETDREVEELGRDSIRAGRQLEDGIGEGAESAERSVRDLVNTMQEDISSIRTSTAFTAVSGLWDMASGAFSSVSGFVDSTQEYRRQLSFLEQNANTKGFDFSALKEQLIEVQALTGDSSSAIEGLSNLLQTDVDERQMEKAIDNLAGAVISFPETLKFESLADGLQETIATGAATGAFAELLERLGVDTEEFNKALEDSPTAAGDLDIALAHLAANGMEEVHKKWVQDNQDMINRMKTQAALQDELATFSETLEKYIVGPVESAALDAMKYINEVVALAEEKGLEAAAEKVGEDAENTGKKLLGEMSDSRAEMSEALEDAAKSIIDFTIGDVIEGAALMLKDLSGGGIDLTEETREMRKIQNATVKAQEKLAKETAAFEAAVIGWGDYNDTPSGETRITAADGTELVPIGIRENWEEELAAIVASAETSEPAMQTAGEAVGTALSTGFEESVEEVEDAAEDAGEAAGAAFDESVARFTSLARMRGMEYGRAFGDGIVAMGGYVAAQTARLASAANSAFGGTRTTAAAGSVSGAMGNVTAVLNIDGRAFARVTAPYMATALSHD